MATLIAREPRKTRPLKLTAPEPSEDQLHASVASVMRVAFRGRPVAWTHFPAGGYFLTRGAAARLYRLGFNAGYPDLLIMWDAKTLWIELKTSKGKLSEAQQHTHALLAACNIPVAVCRTIEDVLLVLRTHGVPMNKLVI
jgi:hypothetical protein